MCWSPKAHGVTASSRRAELAPPPRPARQSRLSPRALRPRAETRAPGRRRGAGAASRVHRGPTASRRRSPRRSRHFRLVDAQLSPAALELCGGPAHPVGRAARDGDADRRARRRRHPRRAPPAQALALPRLRWLRPSSGQAFLIGLQPSAEERVPLLAPPAEAAAAAATAADGAPPASSSPVATYACFASSGDMTMVGASCSEAFTPTRTLAPTLTL